MKCYACGAELNDTAKFCGFCGTSQSNRPAEKVLCVVCSAELTPGTRFCHTCGASQQPVQEPEEDATVYMSPADLASESTVIPELVIAPEPEPMPIPEPEPEPEPEPIPEPEPEPVPEPMFTPFLQPEPEIAPAFTPMPDPVPYQPVQEPSYHPASAYKPAPEPAFMPAPEPPSSYQPPQSPYQRPAANPYQPPQQNTYHPAYQPPQQQYQPTGFQPMFQPQQNVQGNLNPLSQIPQTPAYQLPCQRSLLKMIFLGLLTLGIYPLVIYSRISTEINMVASRYDGERTMHYLFMCILAPLTLFIYPFVWLHNLCNRIGDELERRSVRYNFRAKHFWLWNFLYSILFAVAEAAAAFILYLQYLAEPSNIHSLAYQVVTMPLYLQILIGVGLMLISCIGPFIFVHKMMKATNLMNADYNRKG